MSCLFRRIPHYFHHADGRGEIAGLLNTGDWREVNLITSDAGVTRGRHYHLETEECFVILSGRIRVIFRKPLAGDQWCKAEQIFEVGDVFSVPPLVEHTFDILAKAQWINLLSRPVDPNQPDFHHYTIDTAR